MSFDLIFTLSVTGLMVVLFALERLPAGLVAMMAVGALMAGGIIGPEAGFEGFSSSATVTVTAMFVLSAGVYRSGAVSAVGELLGQLLQKPLPIAILGVSASIAVLSAFVNNTAVVAVFLPVVLSASRKAGTSPSKILIPLSYAGVLGGICTLIGTSTNLIVSSVAVDAGHDAIGMFEMTPLGVILLVAGVLFMATVGHHLLPSRRRGASATQDYDTAAYIVDVALLDESASIGHRLDDAPLLDDLDCDVLAVIHGGVGDPVRPARERELRRGDVLRVRCALDDIPRLVARDTVQVGQAISDEELDTEDAALVEIVIAPDSKHVGRRLASLELPVEQGAWPLAVRHGGETQREDMSEIRLRAGDLVLLLVERDRLSALRKDPEFVIASEKSVELPAPRGAWLTLGILAGVVLSNSFGLMPIATSASLGAVAMLACGCLRQDQAVDAVDWNVIFLLGGLLGVGAGLEASGGVDLVANGITDAAGAWGPTAVLAALYGTSVVMSAFISNNGTAALLAPIALATAATIQVDPRPLLLAVAFGASTCFMTPIGYQTNTLVYGAGHYTFGDFLRVGLPLTLLVGLLTVFLLPVIYGF